MSKTLILADDMTRINEIFAIPRYFEKFTGSDISLEKFQENSH